MDNADFRCLNPFGVEKAIDEVGETVFSNLECLRVGLECTELREFALRDEHLFARDRLQVLNVIMRAKRVGRRRSPRAWCSSHLRFYR